MLDQLDSVVAGNAAAAASFLAATGAIGLRRDGATALPPRGVILIVALLLTGTWATARWLAPEGGSLSVGLLDTARATGWAAFVWLVARRHGPTEGRAGNLLAGVGTIAVIAWAAGAAWSLPWLVDSGRLLLSGLGLAVTYLVIRHAPSARRLSFLGLALGIVFGLDVALSLVAFADPGMGAMVDVVRAPAMMLALPPLMLAAVRNPEWICDVHVSRRLAHQVVIASTVGLAGVIVLTVARVLGDRVGTAATLVAFAVLAGLATAVAVAFGSERRRAGLRLLISRHFFSHRYDYREEWLGFIETLADDDGTDATPLPERVVDAVAQVMTASGGALWLQEEGRMRLAAHRVLVLPVDPPLDPTSVGVLLSLTEDGVVELDRHGETDRGAAVIAGWRAVPDAWLVLPLIHRRRLIGLLALARPRVRRALDWEDRMLLRTLARACGSYLVEDIASRGLQEAREFEQFNRRFAFVAHDLKHVAARLGLTVANAKRFRGNPAFYEDLVETLEDTAARADRLVREMRGEPSTVGGTDLALLVEGVVAGRDGRRPLLEAPLAQLRIQADAARLASALDHLIDNGFDACGEVGEVRVAVRPEARMAVIEVRDNGGGIAPDYFARSFGKPFVTTKAGGMGLGLYEVRHTVEAMGGRLEAETMPGAGTVMRLYLPRLGEPSP